MTNDKLKIKNEGRLFNKIAKRCLHLTLVIGHLTLMLAVASFASQVVDLTEIGVGAKPLGMGKVFNPQDNSGSLFQNPAGIANISKFSLTSMSGNVLGEVPYVMAGGAYKTNYGVVGIGYVNASVGGIREATLVNGVPEITGNEANYGSSTLLIGVANDAKAVNYINNLKFLTDRGAKVGLTLKVVNQGFSGAASFEGANGSGFDLDLGTIVPINDRLTSSFSIKNLIPGNNVKGDELPMAISGGLAYQLPERKLMTAADAEYTTRGLLLHLGAEWNPLTLLFVRGGLDQKADGFNYSLGLGTRYCGFSFDYAYHTYAGLSEMTTHYFSIGFVGEEVSVPVKAPLLQPVITQPTINQPPVTPLPSIAAPKVIETKSIAPVSAVKKKAPSAPKKKK